MDPLGFTYPSHRIICWNDSTKTPEVALTELLLWSTAKCQDRTLHKSPRRHTLLDWRAWPTSQSEMPTLSVSLYQIFRSQCRYQQSEPSPTAHPTHLKHFFCQQVTLLVLTPLACQVKAVIRSACDSSDSKSQDFRNDAFQASQDSAHESSGWIFCG